MIEAVILAAGRSHRMGRPKAALPLTDAADTFLWRLTRTLLGAGLPRVTIVGGAHQEAVRRAWPGHDSRVVTIHNPDWADGQLSSLVAGLDACADPRLEGLLVGLVDVPLVMPATVTALVAAWRASRAPVVRPARHGRHGHPVIFDAAVFPSLRAADPAAGARAVVRDCGRLVLDVPVDDEGAFRDADIPDDYARLADLARSRKPSRTLG